MKPLLGRSRVTLHKLEMVDESLGAIAFYQFVIAIWASTSLFRLFEVTSCLSYTSSTIFIFRKAFDLHDSVLLIYILGEFFSGSLRRLLSLLLYSLKMPMEKNEAKSSLLKDHRCFAYYAIFFIAKLSNEISFEFFHFSSVISLQSLQLSFPMKRFSLSVVTIS